MKHIFSIFILIACAVTIFAQPEPSVAYWKLDETSGSVVDDYVGTMEGTITGSVTLNQTGLLGKCPLFDADAEYISFPDNPTLHMNNKDFSIAGWAKPTSFGVSFKCILGGEEGAASIGTYGTNGYLQLLAVETSRTDQSTAAFTLNQWNFFAVTYDKDAPSNNVTITVNTTTVTVTYNQAFTADAATNIMSGQMAGQNSFSGYLDEIGIWNTVLTSEEITSLRNSGTGKTPPFSEEPPAGGDTLVTSGGTSSYDSTYVLACKNKFAIPEDVDNGDHVGLFKANRTWKGGTISYSMETNHRSAFAVNASTGLITVTDASRIDGKIVQQDTTITLIIRTTDGSYYELDTAEVRVKENTYCKFFDFDALVQGSGAKNTPYSNLYAATWTPGYGFFFKRGTKLSNVTTSGVDIALYAHIASAVHPTIFGAYGTGDKPQISGGGNNYFCMAGTYENIVSDRAEQVYFYEILVRAYKASAWYIKRQSKNMGWYNCVWNNCDQNSYESSFSVNTQSYADSAGVFPFEFIGCEADTNSWVIASEPSLFKTAVGPHYMTNCRWGYINNVLRNGQYQTRFGAGRGSVIKHCEYQSFQALANSVDIANVQLRADRTTFIDVRFGATGTGIYMLDPGGQDEMYPDYLRVSNCYFKGHNKAAIWSHTTASSVNHSVGNIIEDNRMDDVATGININDWYNATIRRNLFIGKGSDGITTEQSPANVSFQYNIFYDFSVNQVYCSNGTYYYFYNNTADGIINCTGTSVSLARNNYATEFRSIGTLSNNLDIDTINTSLHFNNYAAHDYRLRSTAYSAIDHGFNTGLLLDFRKAAVPNNLYDIGAIEYYVISTQNYGNFISGQLMANYINHHMAIHYIGSVILNPNPPDDNFTGTGIYVDIAAVDGNDVNNGATESTPVATLERAAQLVTNSTDFIAISDTVHTGTLSLSSIVRPYGDPLLITTWHKYSTSGKAKIKGLTTVTGFTQNGNYWTKTLQGMTKSPSYFYPQQYYYARTHLNGVKINGKFYHISRYPDDYWTYLAAESGSETTIRDNHELRADNYWNGADLVTELPQCEWVNAKLYVSDYSSNGTFSLEDINGEEQEHLSSTTAVGLKFSLQNHRNAANLNGEWVQYHSINQLEIFYDGNLNNQLVEVPLVDSLLSLSGCSHIMISGIEFYGTNKEQIKLYQSTGITVQSCLFDRPPLAGIASFDCDTLLYQSNVFRSPSSNGIVGVSNNRTAYNYNKITNAGTTGTFGGDRNGWHLAGITEAYPYGDVLMIGNDIDSTGYDGITFASYIDRPDVNVWIIRNWIRNPLMQLTDGAGIYVSAQDGARSSKTKIIRGNLVEYVHDNVGYAQTGSCISRGIYPDVYDRGWLIDSNIVNHASEALFVQNESKDMIYRDNIAVNTIENCDYQDYGMLLNYDGGYMDSVQYIYNTVIFGPYSNLTAVRLNNETFTVRNNMVDYNKYYSPFSTSTNVWMTLNRNTWYNSPRDLTWVRNNTTWEDHSTLDTPAWSFTDVSGITQDQFIQVFYNASRAAHTFSLGNVTLKNIDGTEVSTSLTLPARTGKVLLYKTGTLSTMDNTYYNP